MSREELTAAFRATTALQNAQAWAELATSLLGRVQLSIQTEQRKGVGLNTAQEAIYPHVLRMKRYFHALSRLSFPTKPDGPWLHLVDGAHAIHKSLFEVYVEHALCLTYWHLFGSGPDAAGQLVQDRMRQYADFAKRKRNRGRLFEFEKFLAQVSAHGFDPKLSPGMSAFRDLGIEGAKDDLVHQARALQGDDARFTKVRHWFPVQDPEGRPFGLLGERRSTRTPESGSMEWRCKAVLGKHFPNLEFREIWPGLYDNYYDLLNLYSHPALGYDDNFRSEGERLLDLAGQQVGIRMVFDRCVLPSLQAFFKDIWLPLVPLANQLRDAHESVTRLVLPYLLHVSQFDHGH